MTLHGTEVIHTSIASPRQELLRYLSNLQNWRDWAPWIRSVSNTSDRDWLLDTDVGAMKVRFVEANSFGVLDHDVTLANGLSVHNSMRVLANGTGSEVVMVLFQAPQVSDDEFARDIQAVTDDLARLKNVVERTAKEPIR